jgi:uroporphyrinogen III methyltransferase/synthase
MPALSRRRVKNSGLTSVSQGCGPRGRSSGRCAFQRTSSAPRTPADSYNDVVKELSLSGCRVLLTRPSAQAAPWREALARAGATVIDFPTTEVTQPPSWEPLDQALAQLQTYDWLVFTSVNAVRFTLERLGSQRPTISIAAVGDETARALANAGLPPSLVPSPQSQEGLVAAFTQLPAGARVLFPRALDGRDLLPRALSQRGVVVDVVTASQTRPVPDLAPPPAFDVASFASPSSLTAFVDQLGIHRLGGVPCVVIGETTAAKARALGLRPFVAQTPNIDGVIEAIAYSPWRP